MKTNKIDILTSENEKTGILETPKIIYKVELMMISHLVVSDNDGNGIRLEMKDEYKNLKIGDKLYL